MLQQTTCSKQQWRQQQQEQQLEQEQQQLQQQQQQQELQQTAKAHSYSYSNNSNSNNSSSSSISVSNIRFSNMLPAAHAVSNNTTTTIDFNSRRRRGRLRSALKCCHLVPAADTNVAYTPQQQQQQPNLQLQHQLLYPLFRIPYPAASLKYKCY